MAKPQSFDEFAGAAGRKRAWRALMLSDHGLLRKFYDNSHEVAPGKLWRSYQPSPADLKKWKERGIKTIINLRGDKPSGFLFLEREACEVLGLNLITFRTWSREAPSKAFLHEARALFEKIEYPALIHCKSGADRAGLVAVLYLFLHEGWPLDEALDQLSFKYGHVKHGKTGVIDAAFNEYLAHAINHDIALTDINAFFEWVDTEYNPVQIKQEFQGSLWGRFLSDVILRRE